MRPSRIPALLMLLVVALLIPNGSAGAQRADLVGVRAPADAFAMSFDGAALDTPSGLPALAPAALFTAATPPGEPWRATEGVAVPDRAVDRPSLLGHLAVGTLGGAVVGLAAGYVGYVLLCESSCEWAGLGVVLSTGLGAGAGLLGGTVVYVWKRTRS